VNSDKFLVEWPLSFMIFNVRAREDPNMYRMAELAIGMNPYTRKGRTALGAPNIPATIPPFHEIKISEGTLYTAWRDSGGRFAVPERPK
jgi:hypothetical protein